MEQKLMTAIEWLVEQFDLTSDSPIIKNVVNQAKIMEKEQIIDARQDGHYCTYAEYGENPKCYLDGSSEQYYNETFKQQGQ